jgi:hypothetical protein
VETTTRWERIYFAAVGLSALWIGTWGYFLPAVQKSIPFPVPPLHARFLGAMYLSAFVLLLGGFLKKRWSEIAVVPVMTAIWTGGIFLVSMLHTELFDFSKVQTWIWFVAYAVYPLIALRLVLLHRAQFRFTTGGGSIPSWVRGYLLAQGVLLVVLADLLLLKPDMMVEVWPWPITVPLAQLYSAPFLSFGIGSLALSRAPSWDELMVGIVALAVFAAGVLIASTLHRTLFSGAEVADVLWFCAFALATVLLISLSWRALRHD